jgi:hypothetical protein
MSFRNRPILDRKHRPRWQDERRSQQLLIGAFALAIAVALGIFGATAWNSYYDNHLRQVALVGDERITRDEVRTREAIIQAEILATAVDLQAQLGGQRDALIEQQLNALQSRLTRAPAEAAQSLVDATVQRRMAGALGIEVSEQDVAAEEERRRIRPERLRLAIIVREALPEDAETGTEPSEGTLPAPSERRQPCGSRSRRAPTSGRWRSPTARTVPPQRAGISAWSRRATRSTPSSSRPRRRPARGRSSGRSGSIAGMR